MAAPTRMSRYRFSLQRKDASGRAYLTEARKFGYRELVDNRTHTVEAGDDIFQLAGRYFPTLPDGDSLWWIIAHFQPEPIHDPTRLPAGSVLIIPSERTVIEQILTEKRERAIS